MKQLDLTFGHFIQMQFKYSFNWFVHDDGLFSMNEVKSKSKQKQSFTIVSCKAENT